MRGYPLLLEKGAELCTAINISILHKFENTKHKHFGSVGRYTNECLLAVLFLYLLFAEFENLQFLQIAIVSMSIFIGVSH